MDTLGIIGIYPEVVYKDLTIKQALAVGFSRTLGSFQMIFDSLKLLAYGSASVKDFGGPIMIAQLAGQTASLGMVPFYIYGTPKREPCIFKYFTNSRIRWRPYIHPSFRRGY